MPLEMKEVKLLSKGFWEGETQLLSHGGLSVSFLIRDCRS